MYTGNTPPPPPLPHAIQIFAQETTKWPICLSVFGFRRLQMNWILWTGMVGRIGQHGGMSIVDNDIKQIFRFKPTQTHSSFSFSFRFYFWCFIGTIHRHIRARKKQRRPQTNETIRFVMGIRVSSKPNTISLQYNFTAHRNVERKCNNNLSAENVNICWAVLLFFCMCVCGLKLEIKIFSVFRLDPSESVHILMGVCFAHSFGPFFIVLAWTMRCVTQKKNNKRNPTHSYRLIFVMFVRLEFYSRLRNSCACLFLFRLIFFLRAAHRC